MLNKATVSVPATSANLGPGFDSLGVAFELRDRITATITNEPGVRVNITGEGSDTLPSDESHLVAKVLLETLAQLGNEVAGVELECVNAIPQGKGLGSSAAAIVAGLALAQALAFDGIVDFDWVFNQATQREGHPDNAAACVFGGLVVAWESDQAHCRKLSVSSELSAVVGVPSSELLTDKARGLLPEQVPHIDAAFNAARSALLVVGLTSDPTVLLDATQDRLHQNYRESAYPKTISAINNLANQGIAACVSGAGPAVLAFAKTAQKDLASAVLREAGFTAQGLEFADSGLIIEA